MTRTDPASLTRRGRSKARLVTTFGIRPFNIPFQTHPRQITKGAAPWKNEPYARQESRGTCPAWSAPPRYITLEGDIVCLTKRGGARRYEFTLRASGRR